jgi:hypothetical protein
MSASVSIPDATPENEMPEPLSPAPLPEMLSTMGI